MSRTQIDLDDDSLIEVMRITGVRTKKEAVNLALRDYVDRFRRIDAFAKSRDQAKTWDYEGWGWRPDSGVNRRARVLASVGDVTRWR